MSRILFDYHAIYLTPEKAPPPGGLICNQYTPGPTRAVIWSHGKKAWIFNPKTAARFLYDDEHQERVSLVSRVEAERIAREYLGTELPTEEELHRICAEGEAAQTDR
jgi:hypothetical protein